MSFKMYVDSKGVPFSEYEKYHGMDIGTQRSILSVAERGLWYWNEFLLPENEQKALLSYDWNKWPINKTLNPKNTKQAKKMFFRCADWLCKHITFFDTYALWIYSYQMSYDTKSGWGSSHAQAAGLQLLSRSYLLKRRQRYLKHIDKLLYAYKIPLNEGGLLDTVEKNIIWYEKFADPTNQKPKVLNGMFFALLGLHDVATQQNHPLAQELYQAGLESSLKMIHQFDLGDWSAYDIHQRRASDHYHQIHINQLQRLYDIELNDRILYWRDRFQNYKNTRK